MEAFLASVVIVAILFALLAIKILFKKDGKFPNTHIGGNDGLKARGIVCATSMDKLEQKQGSKARIDFGRFNESIDESLSC